MTLSKIVVSALTLLLATSEISEAASKSVIVWRPTSGQFGSKILPNNAFDVKQTAPPQTDGFLFKSQGWSSIRPGDIVRKATVSLSSEAVVQFTSTASAPICEIRDATGNSRLNTFNNPYLFMGSNYRYLQIVPKQVGKLGLIIDCSSDNYLKPNAPYIRTMEYLEITVTS